MNRNLMNRLSIAAVALVLVLPFTAGCSESASGLVQNPLVASFSGDMDPIVDNSVSLQPATAAGSSDTFKVDVVVGAIDGVNGVAIKIHFNKYFVEFVSGDFSESFLQGAPGRLPNSTPGRRCSARASWTSMPRGEAPRWPASRWPPGRPACSAR